MAKAKGGSKLHRLPFTTFGEIAALGLEIEVHCSSCYRQTKVDPADRRLNDRVFAGAPFRCRGMRDRGFAVPLQPCRAPGFVYIKPAVPAGWWRGDADFFIMPPMRAPLSLPGLPRQDRMALPWADVAADVFEAFSTRPR
jgi:hypothetical protein